MGTLSNNGHFYGNKQLMIRINSMFGVYQRTQGSQLSTLEMLGLKHLSLLKKRDVFMYLGSGGSSRMSRAVLVVSAGLLLVAACGLSLWFLLLGSRGSRLTGFSRVWLPGLQRTGSGAVVHVLSCSGTCGTRD